MNRNIAVQAQHTGRTVEQAGDELAGRALLGRLLTDEVGDAVVAMLAMPGLHAADIYLSAGMVAR